MRFRIIAILLVAAALLWGAEAGAQKHPNIELGLKANGLYQFADLDSVNLFNGNLIVQIPIGGTYSGNASFKYGLTLTYNSKIWDYEQGYDAQDSEPRPQYVTSYPNWRSNAGVGWRLSMGRLLAPGSSSGNVIGHDTTAYGYDAVSMMKSLDADDRNERYLYTADNERIAIVYRVAGSGGVTRNRTLWTLRDSGARLLRTFTDDSTSGTRTWSWTEDEIFRGRRVIASESPSGSKRYHLDHLGSPRLITDAAGNRIGEQNFQPFGGGGSLDGGRLQFTGHERDVPPGGGGRGVLDYMHARFYSSNLGRFLSVDPVVGNISPQTWNRYAYTLNNPVNYLDPDGRYQSWFGAFDFGYLMFAFANSYKIEVQGRIDGDSALADAMLLQQAEEASREPDDLDGKGKQLGDAGESIAHLWECLEGGLAPFVVGNSAIVSGGVTIFAGGTLVATGVTAAVPSYGTSLVFVPAGTATMAAGLYLTAFGAAVNINQINNLFGTHLPSPSNRWPNYFPQYPSAGGNPCGH